MAARRIALAAVSPWAAGHLVHLVVWLNWSPFWEWTPISRFLCLFTSVMLALLVWSLSKIKEPKP
jgi:hypothetical protein